MLRYVRTVKNIIGLTAGGGRAVAADPGHRERAQRLRMTGRPPTCSKGCGAPDGEYEVAMECFPAENSRGMGNRTIASRKGVCAKYMSAY